MADPCIVAASVIHQYGQTTALNDVSFSVGEGCLFGLLGPNGSGKTTLFRLIATLLPLQSGSVTIGGTDLKSEPAAVRQKLGMTFQSPALDVRLTVVENLTCHGRIYGISAGELQQRIHELLEQFALADRQHSIVGELSGGLRRRVELAKGLLHKPAVLLLDEPSTGLDPAARRQFWDLIRDQQQQYGTTVVVTTHLMEEAEACEQLLFLNEGQIVAAGSPRDLQASIDGQRLTIRTRDNAEFKGQLESVLAAEAAVVGDRLCFRLSDAPSGLQRAMDALGTAVISAEVAQPTLEDVFLEKTGRTLDSAENNE